MNVATRTLFPVARTPAAIVALGVDGLADYVKTIGLWRGKAKNVVATSSMLIAEHGGEVPADRSALERLPGVGRKTASVILNTVFGKPEIAVDTHIFRVANRTRMAPGSSPLAVERELMKTTPPEFVRHAHHWLLLHGRYVCKARRPECYRCLIIDLCEYRPKTKPPIARKSR